MVETSSLYFDSIIAARALLLEEEEALEGHTTLSLETQSDLVEDDIYTVIQENFPNFIKYIRHLSWEDQELLLSYYLLGKTQNTLARIHKLTQTVCSFYLRLATRKMGAFIVLGEPTPDIMRQILEKHEYEYILGKNAPLSEVVSLYNSTRSFQSVAETYRIHRPAIRRALSKVSQELANMPGVQEQVLAAYIYGLIDKASASGVGFSKRKLAKQCNIYRCDAPSVLGQFTIRIEDKDIAQLFVPRASR